MKRKQVKNRYDDDEGWIEIGHDPFGRFSIMRRCITNTDGHYSCKWCGNRPKRLWAYGTDDDARPYHVNEIRGAYCGKGCCEAYNDIRLG